MEDNLNNSPFSASDSFFESFESNLMTEINIRSIAGDKYPFVVPNGYFEEFEAQLLQETDLRAISQDIEQIYLVPKDYFVGFEKSVLEQATDLEYKNINHPYTTEKSYFDNFEKNVLLKTIGQNKPNVFKKVWSSKMYRIAASLIFTFGVSFWFVKDNFNKPNINDLTESEIVAYLEEQPNYSLDINSQDINSQDINFETSSTSNLDELSISEEDLISYDETK
jgi:hypothetical protein